MGLISRLLGSETRTGHPSQYSLAAIFGAGADSYAGPMVTEATAMNYSAVYAAVRIISESVAMLPLFTYRTLADGGREKATNHPAYALLHRAPNPEMSKFEFIETLIAHAVLRGNAYAEIEWSNSGRPLALWPLNPAMMTVERVGGNLIYTYRLPQGQETQLPAWRIHHIRGLSGNGVLGYSPIKFAMQSIGLGLALEEYGARFFGNGARPGGVLEHPGVLSDGAYERLKSSWNESHEGLSNAHRLKILEEGLQYKTIGVAPDEAQFLESKKFQISDIARWFRVPLHMLAELSNATFSNIEEQGQEFVSYTLQPWLERHEQALERDLFTTKERESLYVEYLTNGLLRGRVADRYQSYQTGIMAGIMSPNEARSLENMNPYEGGDIYLAPLNMAEITPNGVATPAPAGGRGAQLAGGRDAALAGVSRETVFSGQFAVAPATPPATAEQRAQSIAQPRRAMMRAYVGLYEDVAQRAVRREVNDVRRALDSYLRKRSVADFTAWLDKFYGDLRSVLGDMFRPLMLSLAAQMTGSVAGELDIDDPGVTEELRQFVEAYLRQFADLTAVGSQKQIEAILSEAAQTNTDPAPLIEERLQGWEESKPRKISRQQAFEAGNALIVATYGALSVTTLRWVTNSGACEYCQGLNGKVVGVREYFIQAGERISGSPGSEPMLVRRKSRHGPIHDGCECSVVANDSLKSAPSRPGKKSAGAALAERLAQGDAQADAAVMALSGQLKTTAQEMQKIKNELAAIRAGNWPPFLTNDRDRQAYLAQLEADYQRTLKTQEMLVAELDAATAKAEAGRASRIALGNIGGGDYKIKLAGGNAQSDEAVRFLESFVNTGLLDNASTSLALRALPLGSRGYFDGTDIFLGPDAAVHSYVHEIGHRIERDNPRVLQAAVDFFQRRTQGYSEEPMSNYFPGAGAHERTIVDKFSDPYIGRVYKDDKGQIRATEVVTMGLQYMHEDPVRFAEQDPDHFAFIYDTLNGGGR